MNSSFTLRFPSPDFCSNTLNSGSPRQFPALRETNHRETQTHSFTLRRRRCDVLFWAPCFSRQCEVSGRLTNNYQSGVSAAGRSSENLTSMYRPHTWHTLQTGDRRLLVVWRLLLPPPLLLLDNWTSADSEGKVSLLMRHQINQDHFRLWGSC